MNKVLLKEYVSLIRTGKRVRNRNFLIFYQKVKADADAKAKADAKVKVKGRQTTTKTTIIKTAVKKIAKAHKRNYYKRLLRNVLHSLAYNDSYFILAICLRPIQKPYSHLCREIESLLEFLLA